MTPGELARAFLDAYARRAKEEGFILVKGWADLSERQQQVAVIAAADVLDEMKSSSARDESEPRSNQKV